MTALRTRGLLVPALAALATGCSDQFPNEPAVTTSITEAAPWPQDLAVGEYDTVEIRIGDPQDREVRPLSVTWASSDPAVLAVTRLQPVTTGIGDSLLTQLRAEVHALSRGPATIVVTIVAQGGLRRADTAVDIRVNEHWVAVTTGSDFACAIDTHGEAFCWGGMDNRIALGDGSRTGSRTPVRAISASAFQRIAAGGRHICALSLSGPAGPAHCWGRNPTGAVGNGSTDDQLIPDLVSGGNAFGQISAGGQASCAIDPTVPVTPGDPFSPAESNVFCWGGPWPGVGSTKPQMTSVPTAFSDLGLNFLVTGVAVGTEHACGIAPGDYLWCWGTGALGRLGTGNTLDAATPDSVNTAFQFKSVSAGPYHSCGVTTAGAAMCWGGNEQGEVGRAGLPAYLSPVSVDAPGLAFMAISAGGDLYGHTCAIGTDSLAYCWGHNPLGQLGIGPGPDACPGTLCSMIPRLVDSLLHFQAISTAGIYASNQGLYVHTCGLTGRGAIYCWGSNFFGQLGNPEVVDLGSGPAGGVRPTRICEPPDPAGNVFCPVPNP